MASLEVDDIAIADPQNMAVNATQIGGSGDVEFLVSFAAQTSIGDYSVQVRPELADIAGNAMDQDLDGIHGEAVDDGYLFTVRAIDVDHLISQSMTITEVDSSYDNQDIYISTAEVIIEGSHQFEKLRLGEGASVSPADQSTLTLNITTDLIIDAGSVIDADGSGHASLNGSGAGTTAQNAGGAGHAGNGGNALLSGGSVYGSFSSPSELGSGGGNGWYTSQMNVPGGSGGGVVRITVGGEMTLEGSITANGTDGGRGNVYLAYWSGGGGSGGSIWLDVDTLTGSGVISANGGNGGWGNRAGGGGGGRIAVYHRVNSFTGELDARGGIGVQYGGAGSIYLKSGTDSWGHLHLDNAGGLGATTPIPDGITLDSINLENGARLEVPAFSTLNLAPSELRVQNGGELVVYGQISPALTNVTISVSICRLMEPPVCGLMEPLFCADFQARTGLLFS